MVTSIAGMYHSGSSLTTRVLHRAGLHLGDDRDLGPGKGDAPGERWEHIRFAELNEKILRELGGSGDAPVDLPRDWGDQDRFTGFRERAQQLVASFGSVDHWGWNDPHNSLTLPFWQEVVPGLAVVVCVRHPLEIALLAQSRGTCSYSQSMKLWKTYNERILEAVTGGDWAVTDYANYFTAPEGEVRRLAEIAGLDPAPAAVAEAVASVNPVVRPAKFTIQHLVDAGVAPDVLELYRYLLEHAGAPSGGVRRSATVVAFDGDRSAPGNGHGNGHANGRGREDIDVVPPVADQLAPDFEAAARLEEAERTNETLREVIARQEELIGLAHGLQEQLDRRGNELQSTLYELHGIQTGVRAMPPSEGKRHLYRQSVDRIRQVVHAKVPQDATVLVVSHGDEAVLQLYGRRAWHFPRTLTGAYAGFHPHNSAAAIVHLESMRALGADHLVLPAASMWWLDHYTELRSHLDARYRLLHHQDDTCLVYSLRERPRGAPVVEREAVERLVVEFQMLYDRDPIILDWATGRDLDDMVRELRVFVPPAAGDDLPYLDRSVDIVALGSRSPSRLAEARRVASAAVIAFDDKSDSVAEVYGGSRAPTVTWVTHAASNLPSASIVVPCYNGLAVTRACLETLLQTLPGAVPAEVVVVDDATTDGTSRYLDELADVDPRVRVVRNSGNEGFLRSVTRGAATATGEILVFLNNDTILLPGWLTPLLRTFRTEPHAGVVGGKLLFPDGRVQEAGGLVFRDGSAAKFGGSDPDPTAPLYNFVRDVDYCSGALLATPRALFEQLGGFDRVYDPGYYEDTDYCFRVREHGYRVIYQHESEIVHLEGATAGNDVGDGMKRYQVLNHERFVARWAHVLQAHPERPPQPIDRETLYRLAHDAGTGALPR